MKRKTTTVTLPPDIYEQLRKLSFVSKKPQSFLIEEALRLLFSNVPIKEDRARKENTK